MAYLFTATEESNGNYTHTTAIVKAYGSAYVRVMRDENSKAVVQIEKHFGTSDRVTTQNSATLLALMNGAEGTKKALLFSVKNIVGMSEANFTTAAMNINIANIVEMYPDPDDATDSFLVERRPDSAEDRVYLVDETVAATIAAANA